MLLKTIAAFIGYCTIAMSAAAAPTPIAPHTHPMLPKWALGYWQSGTNPCPATSADGILAAGQLIRSKGHPGDVWISDQGAWNTDSWTDMNWNSANFPDPAGFIRQLHQNHWHMGINIHVWPNGPDDAGFFDRLKPSLDYGTDIIWADLRNPAQDRWIWDYIRNYNRSKGEGEKRIMMLNHYGAATVGWPSNQYCHDNSYLCVLWDLGDSAIFPAYWSGDIETSWNGYQEQIKMITHDYALKGAFTLHMDTPGWWYSFSMQDNIELSARAVQFSDFSPISRQHGQGGRMPVIDADVQPTVNQAQIFSRCLRYRLVPYIYTYYWGMYDQAMPLVRPLVMSFPDDATAADRVYEYTFGDAFLVAPVHADGGWGQVSSGLTTMNIYFPQGATWIDYWSHQVYQGGTSVDYPTNDTLHIPLFVRQGSIIPMGPQIYWIDPSVHPDPLTLDIYPPEQGNEAGFTMYDDDGETYGYENGQYALTPFSCKSDAQNSLTISLGADQGNYPGQPTQRTYVLKINLWPQAPQGVSVGGAVAAEQTVDQVLSQGSDDVWAYDPQTSVAYVRTTLATDLSTTVAFGPAVSTHPAKAGVPRGEVSNISIYRLDGRHVADVALQGGNSIKENAAFKALSRGVYIVALTKGHKVYNRKMAVSGQATMKEF